MAFYKYFWDLEDSTAYTVHIVGQYDNNATTGGGTFRWIDNVINTGITNIPGMRIKPKNSTIGYWHRVFDGPINVGWFGCQNTNVAPLNFASMGVSQATLDLRYGPGFTTTNDCYDSTAIRYALKMMSTEVGYQSIIFDPTLYWISNTCQLPINLVNSSSTITEFILEGNGCTLVKYGNNSFNFFERIPISQSAASITYLNNSFVIKNFNVNGLGGSTWQSTGVFLALGAATNCNIENINISNFAWGIWLQNLVNSTVKNINTFNVKQNSIRITSGTWTGATPSNSSSNVLGIENIKVVDTLNQLACVDIYNSNNLDINQVSITGLGNPAKGIMINGFAGVTNACRISNSYFNVLFSDYAIGMDIPSSGGRLIVDGVNNVQTNTIVAINTGNAISPDIYIANIGTWAAGSTLQNTGVGAATTWDLYNVRFGAGILTAANVVDPLNNLWNVPLGTIPLVGNVRYIPPIAP